MGAPGFWDNNERAQKHIAKLNGLKAVHSARGRLPEENRGRRRDDRANRGRLRAPNRRLTPRNWTRPPPNWSRNSTGWRSSPSSAAQFDKNNAILSIQAGAGGTGIVRLGGHPFPDVQPLGRAPRVHRRGAGRAGRRPGRHHEGDGADQGGERLWLRQGRARRSSAGADQSL